jgi:uroporphyrinogen decarboxylase
MTPRQRYIETLTFGSPDRIPFHPGGGRKSTRARWHKEGLPEAKNPIAHVMELLGIEPDHTEPPVRLDADFRMIPQFEEEILEHRNGHYVVRDWKGNICEISDEYDVTYLREAIDFVTRRWISCPVETRDDWEQMKTRYDIDAPGRFPADFAARCEMARQRNHVLSFRFAGPFWQMREWCGFEGLCILMAEQPEFVGEMAEFWTDFVSRMLERILARVVPDSVGFNEDMAYKAKAMISPAMTRRFCKPSWDRWTHQLRFAGVPLIDMDSDGFIGELIPIWIESGINVCDPIEVAAHNDIVAFRHRFGHQMAYTGGVDKRAMAKGGHALREEIRRVEPVVRDGGYIPGCDHGIPADVSWQDFVDYCRLLARITGWL